MSKGWISLRYKIFKWVFQILWRRKIDGYVFMPVVNNEKEKTMNTFGTEFYHVHFSIAHVLWMEIIKGMCDGYRLDHGLPPELEKLNRQFKK